MDMDKIVILSLSVLVASFLLPIAIDNWFSTDTTLWDPAVADIWVLIPLAAVLTVAIAYFRTKRTGGNA